MQTETKIIMIPTERLHPHPDNPRKDVGDVSELAESIKVNGILQNLTVVPKDDDYTVIIGHRRLAASKLAGLDVVPCVIADMTDKEQLSTMLTENMQRTDLTIYEQAKAFQQLQLDLGMSVDEIAEKAGFSRSTVYKRLKLAELDEKSFKKAVERGATIFDFAELDKLETPEAKQKVLDVIGTSNFKNVLRAQIDAQNNKHKMDKWLEQIKEFATEITETRYEKGRQALVDGEWIPVEYRCNYGSWTPDRPAEKPISKEDVRCFYKISSMQISIYTEAIEDPEKDAEQERKDAIRRADDEKWEEMQDIMLRHRMLRREFVLNYGSAKKNINRIIRAAIDVMLAGGFINDNLEEKYKILGIEYDSSTDTADEDELLKLKDESPERTLLLLVYKQMDGGSYARHKWEYNVQRYVIEYNDNAMLDMLYDFLEDLGYEASDEEFDIMSGTHELYWKEGETCE